MGRKYQIRTDDYFYFVTFTVVDWIDIFISSKFNNIIIDSLKFCQSQKGLLVGGYCIMTNHIHLIVKTSNKNNLSDTIRDFKSFTSRSLRKELESSHNDVRKKWILSKLISEGKASSNTKDFKLWQHHNHPIELNTNYIIDSKLNYLHFNPVKAGFVDRPEDWVYSSAKDYCGTKGLIEVYFLD
jgi:REP element-mobilizing transposase RayT